MNKVTPQISSGNAKVSGVFMMRCWCLLILPLFVSGCLHTVNYNLTKGDRWNGPKINGVVRVQPITDQTVFDLAKWRPEYSGTDVWRNNYRGGYNSTNLTDEVTAMIVRHLAYSGLFTKVVSGTKSNADYVLSGALTDYQTHGRVTRNAEVVDDIPRTALFGSGFGWLATGPVVNTEIKTSVKLNELKLTDKADKSLWHDSIVISYDITGTFPESLYVYPDRSLKEAVNEMIHRLGNSSLTNSQTVATP